MVKTFGLMRDQPMHDFDVSRVNAWIKTVNNAKLLTAVAHGAFQLTMIYTYEGEKPKEEPKTDTL